MDNIFELIKQSKGNAELELLTACNEKSQHFGLSLTKEESQELMLCRNESLKKYKRVEFGSGILDKLIFTFCDSQYIDQDNYLETLEKLQDIFYEFKNESMDRLTDDELLTFMREQFEDICFGDLDYLENTCLERFSTAIRAGYTDYKKSGAKNEYDNFSEEKRWDKDLYMQAVNDLF